MSWPVLLVVENKECCEGLPLCFLCLVCFWLFMGFEPFWMWTEDAMRAVVAHVAGCGYSRML